jgi:hypothetical protein
MKGADAAYWAWRAKTSSKRLKQKRQALDELMRRNDEFLADALDTLQQPVPGQANSTGDAHMNLLRQEQDFLAAETKRVRNAIGSLLAFSDKQLARPDATALNLRELVKGHEIDLIHASVRRCEKLAAAFRDLISKTRAFLTLKMGYSEQLQYIEDLATEHRRVRVALGEGEAGWLQA